jgi:hypothetical protein
MQDIYKGLTYTEKCVMDAMRISEYQLPITYDFNNSVSTTQDYYIPDTDE